MRQEQREMHFNDVLCKIMPIGAQHNHLVNLIETYSLSFVLVLSLLFIINYLSGDLEEIEKTIFFF